MTTKKFASLLAAASLGLLAACGTSSEAPAPAPAPAPTTASPAPQEPTYEPPVNPANPVDILRKIKGCTLEDGAVGGEWTVDNLNKFASCNYYNNGGGLGAEVTVYTTVPGTDPIITAAPEGLHPDDSTAYIVGDDFLAMLTQVPGGYEYYVDPEDVATAVGGEVFVEETAPAKEATHTRKSTPSSETADPDPAHVDIDAEEESEGALLYDTDGDPEAEEFTPDYEGKSSAELQAEWIESQSKE